MNNKQKAAISGSALLIVGVFLPILSVPILGSIDYFRGGEGDGVVILALGIVSLVLALTKKYKGLIVTSALSIGMLGFTLVNFYLKMSEMKAEYAKTMGDNPFAGLGQMAMETIKLEWGWVVLIAGVVLLGVSVAMKEEVKEEG